MNPDPSTQPERPSRSSSSAERSPLPSESLPPNPSSPLSRLSPEALSRLEELTRPRLTRYVPTTPTAKQAAFLYLPCLEAFYGGAAGGGKSESLLAAALAYVDVPGYTALLLRRTYQDLALPGALMDRAKSWLLDTPASWLAKEHAWRFPTVDPKRPARLVFGYCEDDGDLDRYASAEFQYIGLDELTQFTERQYRFFFSRLRKPAEGPLAAVPIRIRSASNPGNVGHDWVRSRFIVNGRASGRVFVPANFRDNRHVSKEYSIALDELDPVMRARLRDGDWDVEEVGEFFSRAWIRSFRIHGDTYVLRIPPTAPGQPATWKTVPIADCLRIAVVDLAISLKPTADFTVISTFAITPDREILHVDQFRKRCEKAEQLRMLAATIRRNRCAFGLVETVAYQMAFLQDAQRAGLPVREVVPDTKKESRWLNAATYVKGGRYYVLEDAPWREDLETELVRVNPKQGHDDQADALAYGCAHLSDAGSARVATSNENRKGRAPTRKRLESFRNRERTW